MTLQRLLDAYRGWEIARVTFKEYQQVLNAFRIGIR